MGDSLPSALALCPLATLPPCPPVARPERELPVAVFDSGVGGLTVLHECLVTLPHEHFVYLGDTARFRTATGPRSSSWSSRASLPGSSSRRGEAACRGLQRRHVRGASGLKELAGRLPVVGVVRPESRLAAAHTRNGRVGLIATPATVASGAYGGPSAPRHRRPAPRGRQRRARTADPGGGEVDERTIACVEGACRPLKAAEVDTVILGCTHYPLVRPVLQASWGAGWRSSARGTRSRRRSTTSSGPPGSSGAREKGDYRFLATGDPDGFRRLGTRFLQLPIDEVRHVDVEPARRAAA